LGLLGSSPFSSLGLNLHSWCFSPSGVEEGKNLHIGGVDANGMRKLSLEQLLGALGKGLFILFSSNFLPISSICKP